MTEGMIEAAAARRLLEVNIEALNWLGYILTCKAVRVICHRAVLLGIFTCVRLLH